MNWLRSASRRAVSRRGTLWTLAALTCCRPALGQAVEGLESGLQVGRVLLAPSLTAAFGYDTNVFLFDATSTPPPEPQAISTLAPAVKLIVPFRASAFRFSDTYQLINYTKTTSLNGRSSNVASADLDLRFSTGDTLALTANRTNGVATTVTFDPGGEALFRGQSYLFQQQMVRLSREEVGQRGYRVSVSHNELRFEPDQQISFFNYDGYDAEAAALIPVSEITNLSFGYLGARYDHYDLGAPDPSAVFRREAGDTVYAGLEGNLGPRAPYHLRIGWENLTFALGSPLGTDYHGIVGQADLAVVGGGGFSLTSTLIRQPYRSFVFPNNYYLFTAAVFELRQPLAHGSSAGGRLAASRSAYPDPVPYLPPGQSTSIGIDRNDDTYFAEAYANLAVREHVLFRITLREALRSSTFPGGDFHDTVLSGGFVFGWL